MSFITMKIDSRDVNWICEQGVTAIQAEIDLLRIQQTNSTRKNIADEQIDVLERRARMLDSTLKVFREKTI